MASCYGIILATDMENLMKSKLPKALHRICGKPIVDYIIDTMNSAGIKDIAITVDSKDEILKEYIGNKVNIITIDKTMENQEHNGCLEYLKDKIGNVFILGIDTPLLKYDTILSMIEEHNKNENEITIGHNPEEGYATAYCFNIDLFRKIKFENLDKIKASEVIRACVDKNAKITSREIISSEVLRINTRIELEEANKLVRKRIVNRLMEAGVSIIDAAATYIDYDVVIGQDTVVYPGAIIEGNTSIGEDCIIGPNSRIIDSRIGNGVEIQNSVVLESSIDNYSNIGPFAYIRPDSEVGSHVKIGDFVEIKKSKIGNGTKVSHLTYIGDAEVGKGCNFGCGTVFVNYDGTKKHKTIIGDNAFIGCNCNLVAPVEIGNNAYLAAGSTITENVPDGALAIARGNQVNKEGWVEKKGIWKK